MHTAVAPIPEESLPLPALIQRAAATLSNATSAAEVLEARDMASVAYDAAKRVARLAKAKDAHDEIISAAYHAQADALAIEAAAKRRMADEYDAAQERGEVAKSGDTLKRGPGVPEQNTGKATAAEVGLTRKQVHEARMVRNAEAADPGVVERTAKNMANAGQEPTRAAVRRIVDDHRSRVSVPDGETMESLCRKGLALVDKGEAVEDVARKLGVGAMTFRAMRRIVLLADHDGLAPDDAAFAAEALAEMNKQRRSSAVNKSIDGIAKRVWGDGKPQLSGNAEAKRKAAFERALGALTEACLGAAGLTIPYLDNTRQRAVAKEVDEAIANLRHFRTRLKETT